uniref:Uncharacterized protein n=2 Tax=Triticinae TaxID=1648030 RepID=A0A453EWR7_AEGTS
YCYQFHLSCAKQHLFPFFRVLILHIHFSTVNCDSSNLSAYLVSWGIVLCLIMFLKFIFDEYTCLVFKSRSICLLFWLIESSTNAGAKDLFPYLQI